MVLPRGAAPVSLGVILLLAPVGAAAQEYAFSSNQWQPMGGATRVVQYLGRQSLYTENSGAALAGVTVGDGTIEVDVSSPAPVAFAHVLFRAQAVGEAEDIYLRLAQSGSPGAVQYAPVYHSVSAWQLEPAGQGRAVFDKNAWTHLRIVLDGSSATVYVNDSPQPVLIVPHLRRGPDPGTIAVSSEFASYFSNFRLTAREPGAAVSVAAAPSTVAPGVLLDWEVSDAFSVDSLRGVHLPAVAGWIPARADVDGLLNISRFRAKPGNSGAVLARATIHSARAQVKKAFFGYSDNARIYLNGRPLFEGVSAYRSRDPSFAGMIGWNDAVYLDLKPGDNELLFAVAESFGGWGLQVRLADTDGVRY
jgi:hypothetical protein